MLMPRLLTPLFALGIILGAGLAFSTACQAQDFLGSTGSSIVQYDPSGSLINASFITGLNHPEGIVLDSSGNIYVANEGGGNVLEYSSSGSLLQTFTGLTQARGVALDASGNLWASSSNMVVEYSPSGTLLHAMGGFSLAWAIAADAHGNVYVADLNTNTISVIDAASATVTNADYLSGHSGVFGLAVNSAGSLLVSSVDSQVIQEYGPTGALLNSISNTFPSTMAFDSSGNLYVSQAPPFGSGSVAEYDPSGNLLNTSFLASSNRAIAFQPSLAPVPEPSTLAGPLAICFCGLMRRRRR